MDELNYKDAYLALVRAVDDVIRYLEIPGQAADRHFSSYSHAIIRA